MISKARRFIVVLALVMVTSACGRQALPVSSPSPVVIGGSVSGSLDVTPTGGSLGTQVTLTWETTVSGVIQVCSPVDSICRNVAEVREPFGQVSHMPSAPGRWPYRLLGFESEAVSSVLDTKEVTIR